MSAALRHQDEIELFQIALGCRNREIERLLLRIRLLQATLKALRDLPMPDAKRELVETAIAKTQRIS
jgi:hypothetical protein